MSFSCIVLYRRLSSHPLAVPTLRPMIHVRNSCKLSVYQSMCLCLDDLLLDSLTPSKYISHDMTSNLPQRLS